jgi:hypothetical protein
MAEIVMTARELMDCGLWADYCRVTGTNEWAVNEGLMPSDEPLHITGEQWARMSETVLSGQMTEEEMQECRLDQLDEADTREALDAMAREGMVSPLETFCIDCGQPTTPGKGSARCPGCWEDRCGQ